MNRHFVVALISLAIFYSLGLANGYLLAAAAEEGIWLFEEPTEATAPAEHKPAEEPPGRFIVPRGYIAELREVELGDGSRCAILLSPGDVEIECNWRTK